MPQLSRRDELAEQATDYALGHGLIGLSLRPLAAAIGTSDRMLLYHFTDKDDLVATVLRVSNDRSLEALREVPDGDDVRSSVQELWRCSQQGQLERCQRLYVEAAALGLLGLEPYASTVREANEHWMQALASRFERVGCQPASARRIADLVEPVMVGLLLDRPLDPATPDQARVIDDLADAVAAMA